MKIRSMGAKLFHEDRLDDANGRFSEFTKAPRKESPEYNEYNLNN